MTAEPETQTDPAPGNNGNCGIVWFRNDLRVEDNPAWDEATQRHRRVVALYVLDPAIEQLTGPLRRRRHLMELKLLDETLRGHGGRLHLVRGSPLDLVPRLAEELGAGAVYVNASPSPLSRYRDTAVAELLVRSTRMSSHWGNLVHPPGSLTTTSGNVSRVFTAFWKRWRNASLPDWVAPAADQASAAAEVLDLTDGSLRHFFDTNGLGRDADDPESDAGSNGAHARLAEFVEHGLDRYREQRDAAYLDGTSGLSVALHFGTIAPVRVMSIAASGGGDAEAFIRQLAWRDWYAHLLWENPTLPRHAMRPEFDAIQWRNDGDEIDAWKQGLTGYPIVDAGMRQLAQTGRMHNRVRMIVASFLVKDLLADWRVGERHFRRTLLDGDVAQNVGNWQWVAGTGPDAAPYFRIFNPTKQGETHDPNGEYVRRWVPELAQLPTRHIHAPWKAPQDVLRRAGVTLGLDYPKPIVDHSAARHQTLAAYQEASSRSTLG